MSINDPSIALGEGYYLAVFSGSGDQHAVEISMQWRSAFSVKWDITK